MGCKFGAKDSSTKAIGGTTKSMDADGCSILKETFMKASGWTTKDMERELLFNATAQNMKAAELKISNRAQVKKHFHKAKYIKGALKKDLKVDMGSFKLQKQVGMKENLRAEV